MKLSELEKLKDTMKIFDTESGEVLSAKELKDTVSSMKSNDYSLAQIQDFLLAYKLLEL